MSILTDLKRLLFGAEARRRPRPRARNNQDTIEMPEDLDAWMDRPLQEAGTQTRRAGQPRPPPHRPIPPDTEQSKRLLPRRQR
ncbi:MAG: hypothetical protein R2787_17880 [Saprospiraceae bacterium]